MPLQLSPRVTQLLNTVAPISQFLSASPWAQKHLEPDVCDFAIGNPQDMPLAAFVDALKHWAEPQDKSWYGYKQSGEKARVAVATSLSDRYNRGFLPEDIFMTNGAFAGNYLTFKALLEPGEEFIFLSPAWFFYEGMITDNGGIPVKVRVKENSFNLDLKAIEEALTPKTRGIVINSPHNPTGKVYSPEVLESLADLLKQASKRFGKDIFLLSDEAYRVVVFDGLEYMSPSAYYPNSIIVYTYGKSLLTPGQRIGYIALSPEMPKKNREVLRTTIPAYQNFVGFSYPNALLQHAIEDLEAFTIDISLLQKKRDYLVENLKPIGYEPSNPEGAFYVMVRSPVQDDWSFARVLGDLDILVMPGEVVEMPGFIRLSLTASEAMIEKSLPGFKEALEQSNFSV